MARRFELTKTELKVAVGGNRQHVSKVLNELIEAGTVSFQVAKKLIGNREVERSVWGINPECSGTVWNAEEREDF